ncbi:terminase, partial [Salmonella enterica subsp. enterica serovar Oslo]|nr:terminase [Salmonella enterica subsp. enterica serovar Oslo]
DSDFFKVRVRGLFPSASDLQFIPQSYADAGMSRKLEHSQYGFAPKIIGVDPAYSGSDEACIYLRQGLYARLLGSYPKTDEDVNVALVVAANEVEHKAHAVIIDFGYGNGIQSVVNSAGRKSQHVSFAGESKDPAMHNKRGEM